MSPVPFQYGIPASIKMSLPTNPLGEEKTQENSPRRNPHRCSASNSIMQMPPFPTLFNFQQLRIHPSHGLLLRPIKEPPSPANPVRTSSAIGYSSSLASSCGKRLASSFPGDADHVVGYLDCKHLSKLEKKNNIFEHFPAEEN